MESYFSTLPLEVTLDLLALLDKKSVTQFACVSKNQKNQFEKHDGIWKQLVCRLYHWGTKELSKVQQKGSEIDWKKENRISAYFNDKIRKNQIYADPSQTQFKFFSVVDEASLRCKYSDLNQFEELVFFYFNIQSKCPLYPLPIGNFSVAYYEVEILGLGGHTDEYEVPGYIFVGGALDGFVNGLPGVGRNSYSYCTFDGRIVLENDFGVSSVPPCTVGDIVGFGINFLNHSVFFTKNGKVVAEATKTQVETSIINLKTIHATIGFGGVAECKINLGSAPFAFDVLHYQQEKAKTKMYIATKFYSEVLREHLVAFSESETFGAFDSWEQFYAPMDYNLPPPETKLNPFLYLSLYMRIPANFVPPNEIPVQDLENALKALAHCRAITNAYPMLLKMEKDETARLTLDYLANCLEVQEEGKSYEEFISEVVHTSFLSLRELFRNLIGVCLNDLLKDYSCFYTHLLVSFILIGSFEPQHHLSQIAARAFYKAENIQTPYKKYTNDEVQQAINTSLYKLLGVRRMAVLFMACEKIKYRIRPQKEKDRAEALHVYGNDKVLESLFQTVFTQMTQAQSIMPRDTYEEDVMTVLSEAKSGVMDRAITYGLFKFDLRPDQYTEAELNAEVMQRLSAKVTDEVKRNYLQHSLDNLRTATTETVFLTASVMEQLFGFDPAKITLPEKAMDELEKSMKESLKKLDRKIKRKKQVRQAAAKQNKKSTTIVIVGASVAVATIALVSAMLFMRKKSK